ncbi:MAG: DUF512 domain-containing protein [Ruminococcaceae bacterium]|nr:DUF512 domain-containing protein [Oscillospiraceae bacterium]
MVRITCVEPHSRAARAGIAEGDLLLTIGGREIEDVLDYRFYLADTLVTLECEREGKRFAVSIKKGEYDDIGLGFETPLMDEKHSCRNKCIFCFIDQLPQGLRETLYFKDDDARLSFLHGNYITLTNLKDKDVERITRMHISPVNVSVHTTNPDLRVFMMKNKRAGEVLSYLERFRDAGIRICAQIVLCRGVNDGAELDRSMRDLCTYLPALSSVSVVPAGLTRFREGLHPLTAYTPEECRAIVAQVDAFGEECLKKYGTRLFFCADELYVKGGLALPPDEYYEEYAQIENGVGMLRALSEEFAIELSFLAESDLPKTARTVSIATGVAAYERIAALAKVIEERVPALTVKVYKIVNHFFGESVTVTGLLTGKDLAEQLADKALGDQLLLSSTTLRAEGDLFLCGMTPKELSEKLAVPVRFVDSDGAALVEAILGK